MPSECLSGPPAPPPLPPPVDPPAGPVREGRLHPLTLVVTVVQAVRNFIIPALIVFLTGSESTLGVLLLVAVVIQFIVAGLRYVTFRYRVEAGELITTEGVLERRQRHIPLTRVQDLRSEQGPVQRLLGVVTVQVETAGGQGAEATLAVLSRAEAERLREAVFAEAARRRMPATDAAERGPTEPVEQVIRRLRLSELLWAGLTSNHAASVIVLFLAAFQFADDLVPEDTYRRFTGQISSQVQQWTEQNGGEGHAAGWPLLLAGAGTVLGIGLLLSMAGSVVLFYGFTLSRRGEDLHRTYGLLTRRSSSLPRRRIQILKVDEPWLRRALGLVTLRVESAGRVSAQEANENRGRDLVLPVARRAELPGILPVLLPEWAEEPAQWRPVSRCAIRRGTKKGVLGCLLVAGVSWGIQHTAWALWPLGLIPAVYWINRASYRHQGFSLTERLFQTRRGWLSRATHVVPVRNTQVVVLQQSPFDRRHGVVTLAVDTAGQKGAGHGPQARNVPSGVAATLGHELARRAAVTRYRW